MSKVFNQTIQDIADYSGCDWDFVVNMYNYLWNKHSDFRLLDTRLRDILRLLGSSIPSRMAMYYASQDEPIPDNDSVSDR